MLWFATGAQHAMLTDREPLALDCALRSARASGISDIDLRLEYEHASSVVSLSSPSKVTSVSSAARTRIPRRLNLPVREHCICTYTSSDHRECANLS